MVYGFNPRAFVFLPERVRKFDKAVSSSSKGFVTVEDLCGALISLSPGPLGYCSQDQLARSR
jgi:hypothetical protein